METSAHPPVAIVGIGGVLPDAPNVEAFWKNITEGRYSISEVDPERWDPKWYFDPDPSVPDKTYSKIGGWVRDWNWDPLKWKLPIPPKVSDAMDRTQKFAILAAREALADFDYENKQFDPDRTAVILGNAMAGDTHYMTAMRIHYPEFAKELEAAPSFKELPDPVKEAIATEVSQSFHKHFPDITEDTMPGELANIIAGRVANLFNFHGPNYVVDAACASAMAAFTAAVEGLQENDYDLVVTGGVDSNMSASTFTKFCKIGALSPTGTRPFANGADGFVMGEGSGVFVLKRLEDAERDGDKIYAVIRGIGGSSDGKGKGITAPNPIGQRLALERGWKNAGRAPDAGTLIEGHGTSTRVGDVVETESLAHVFKEFDLPAHSIPMGSVKSNIGHLKGAAGAAGMLKATLALYNRTLPASINCPETNPNIDFESTPLYVNTETRPWDVPEGVVRSAGVSAFGFGGTNFHVVLEEYVPGHLETRKPSWVKASHAAVRSPQSLKAPLRGAWVAGAASMDALQRRVEEQLASGEVETPHAPEESDLRAPYRLAIDYGSWEELAKRLTKAKTTIENNDPARWRALRGRGIFLGTGEPEKVAFLFPGQGSQYVNMLKAFRDREDLIRDVFDEADQVMQPILGKGLSEYIFIDSDSPEAVAQATEDLRQTEITQPAVLATDFAVSRLLGAYGIHADMVMGHSLGEYGALVASGALPFADALKAVSARAHAMREVSLKDNGGMAAAFGPVERIQELLDQIDEYVVVANINSYGQAVIGGSTPGIDRAIEVISEAGITITRIPVSHAFHTEIVAPASASFKRYLGELDLHPPTIPIVANLTGDFYPMHPGAHPEMIETLGRQIASPVQFVKGLETLYDNGIRVFVEVGPKRALTGFVVDVLGKREDVAYVATNHPKQGDVVSFNHALCALYAAGHGFGQADKTYDLLPPRTSSGDGLPEEARAPETSASPQASLPENPDRINALGHLFAEFLERGREIVGEAPLAPSEKPVVITGAALGLPGSGKVFAEDNVARILRGESFLDTIPVGIRKAMVDKHITRLVKSADGAPRFEVIDSTADVIKLAGRPGLFDLEEYGIPADIIPALNSVTQLAMAVGIEALHDAGIPLVQRYKTTTKGTFLPDRWGLPDALRDETGVIFASAFPTSDALAGEIIGYHEDREIRLRIEELRGIRDRAIQDAGKASSLVHEIDQRLHALEIELEQHAYALDRKFLFKVLSMGHSQFAQLIGARGPNTQINSACASTTQAVAMAEDWIRLGRCRRVIIVAADNPTSDNLMEWMGAGFLASGAAATDEVVEDAAIPFDRRRHGMLVGMGAAALVVEDPSLVRERGMRPVCDVLGTVSANSAFHGSRLDVNHICDVMENLVADAEKKWGVKRSAMAADLMFMSHETYTPARGGSAAAEVNALRHVFGENADLVLMANTKGFTGHAMGTGIEDVVAVKALETGIIPPVANFKEVDPDLGVLNLSKGGFHNVHYALRLGAGFGSQISMSLMRWRPNPDGERRNPDELGYAYRVERQETFERWLKSISGNEQAQLEVVSKTLRIADGGPPSLPASSGPATIVEARSAHGAAPSSAHAAAAAPAAGASAAGEATAPPATTPATPAPAAVSALDVAPSSAAPAEPVPAAASGDSAVGDGIAGRVMDIVAEVTGYPTDMLDPDLDLEADLGIDTVKQAETFAAVRAAFDIERDDTLQLRDFPTLAHVVRFAEDGAPQHLKVQAEPVATVPEAAEAASAPESPSPSPDAVTAQVVDIAADITGYPSDMLDMDLDLEADLGIDTVKQAEMFAAIRAAYDIPRDDALQLRDFPTLAHVVQFAEERAPASVLEAKRADSTDATLAPAPDTPAPVPPAPAAPAPPDKGASQGSTAITQQVVSIAAGITGYPDDMLDLDLDLEADLGIDTVKQAEMFAAIRAEYDIPREDTLQLRDFPTLAQVVKFAEDRTPGMVDPPATLEQAGAGPPPDDTAPDDTAPDDTAPDDDITTRVVEIAADITGYPADMLDMDLDLEADLGIDTVKQAEMFASIRAAYDISRDDALQLRDFPTLAHVVQFARDRKPSHDAVSGDGLASEVDVVETKAPETGIHPTRRVPVSCVLPDLATFRATGVEFEPGDRVIIAPDQGGVAKALAKRLSKKSVEVLLLKDLESPAAVAEQVDRWLDQGAIRGTYWLPALDRAGDPATTDLVDLYSALDARVRSLHAAAQKLYVSFGTGRFFVSATRLDGQHGFSGGPIHAPFGGAVIGFTKALRRERPLALIKAVDFPATRQTAWLADRLLDEALRDAGSLEIGYVNQRRFGVRIEERPLPASASFELPQRPVVVVTGAAGSIVSAITTDLGTRFPGEYVLMDLAPEPDPEDADLKAFAENPQELKRVIFERLKASGERATPALVERQIAALERKDAALRAIEAVRAAGGNVHYVQCDLTDAKAVRKAIKRVRTDLGPVDLLLHAAGLEISRILPDKSADEFNLVFDVKALGYLNLLKALGARSPKATVVFSSIAGRFGNGGQTDYSAANDFLAKLTRANPQTRGITIDWTAWADIGMASRGSIPTMMARAGIEMLSPASGIPAVRRELLFGDAEEVVMAEGLGQMLEPLAEDGGLLPQLGEGPMSVKAIRFDAVTGAVIETSLDPAKQGFLNDHRIDGTPVLPGVMGLEAFAEVAAGLVPSLAVRQIENVRFLAPFKFYRDEPRSVFVEARLADDQDDVLVQCRLIGRRKLATSDQMTETVHFTATVRMDEPADMAPIFVDLDLKGEPAIGKDSLYDIYFHGPAYQVLRTSWRRGGALTAEMDSPLPENSESGGEAFGPRAVELAFQAAGVLEMQDTGLMGLPAAISTLAYQGDPASAKYVFVSGDPETGFHANITDEAGRLLIRMEGYQTAKLPKPLSDEERKLLSGVPA